MSSSDKKLTFNDRDCEYDYYGDTRNNPKFNEEKYYAKNSFNFKIYRKIYNSKWKKETQKANNEEKKQEKEIEMKEKKEQEESQTIYKSERKRKLKIIEKDENNFQKIEKKAKKNKKPRKDRIRF